MRTVEVYHEFTGASDSPVLVLAGPLGTTLEIWDPLVEALSERFRVLRYDHRGHGRSPAPGGSFSVVDLAVDAVALLDRRTPRITRPTGRGWSGQRQFAGWAPQG